MEEDRAMKDEKIRKMKIQKEKDESYAKTEDVKAQSSYVKDIIIKDNRETVSVEENDEPGDVNEQDGIHKIVSKDEEKMEQSDGTNDVNQTTNKTDSLEKPKISITLDGDDGLIDSSSDHLVITEETALESNNGKHVTFCCPGDELTVTDKSVETEETVEIDTTLETNNTLESNTTLDTHVDTTLETAETGNYTSADTDEFAKDDEDYEFPLTQNVHRERYLKYKPVQDTINEEQEEGTEWIEEEGPEEAAEGDGDEVNEEDGDDADTR